MKIDAYFARECGWTPGQVDELTLSEITVALYKADGHSVDDIRSGVDNWRRMNARQKLEWAKANEHAR